MAATAPLSAPEKRRGVRREDEMREGVVGERMRGKTYSLPHTHSHTQANSHIPPLRGRKNPPIFDRLR